jgi:hypothetical protein
VRHGRESVERCVEISRDLQQLIAARNSTIAAPRARSSSRASLTQASSVVTARDQNRRTKTPPRVTASARQRPHRESKSTTNRAHLEPRLW